MGGSSYSDDYYNARVADRKATNTPTFDYDHKIKTGAVAAACHPKLDPKGVVREARDSTAHPKSKPIIVAFDQTGSMGGIPVTLQQKLPQLMGLLLRKGYIQDPQILFACFGDWYNHEKAPLQIGQFESGIEMDDDITRFYLEGNGGGQQHESYENVFYFASRKTSCDAWLKRGEKGYLFIIGDEQPFDRVSRAEAEAIFGDKIESDIPIKALIEEASVKWEIFFLIPKGCSYENSTWLKPCWEALLPAEHVITIEPDLVCEAIGSIVGLLEGNAPADKLTEDLKSAGVDAHAATVVSAAVDPLAKTVALVKVGHGSLPASVSKSAAVERF